MASKKLTTAHRRALLRLLFAATEQVLARPRWTARVREGLPRLSLAVERAVRAETDFGSVAAMVAHAQESLGGTELAKVQAFLDDHAPAPAATGELAQARPSSGKPAPIRPRAKKRAARSR